MALVVGSQQQFGMRSDSLEGEQISFGSRRKQQYIEQYTLAAQIFHFQVFYFCMCVDVCVRAGMGADSESQSPLGSCPDRADFFYFCGDSSTLREPGRRDPKKVRNPGAQFCNCVSISFCALRIARTPAKILYNSSRIRHVSSNISSGEYFVDQHLF